MKITVLTIFPHMFDSFLKESILGRAIAQGLLAVEPVDLRPFSDRKHKNTDDDPFGGGAGVKRGGGIMAKSDSGSTGSASVATFPSASAG